MCGPRHSASAALGWRDGRGETPARWRKAGAFLRHRGHDIFYRRGGGGEALLVVDGFPTASYDFHKIWPGLAGRFDVVAPDMTGFGFSAKPRGYRYSLFDRADLMEGLLGDLGFARVHILARAPVPLQLVYGPEDPISGTPVAERFAQIVPDPDIVALDGVGHYPQLEAPERTLAAFDAFHDRLGTPR